MLPNINVQVDSLMQNTLFITDVAWDILATNQRSIPFQEFINAGITKGQTKI